MMVKSISEIEIEDRKEELFSDFDFGKWVINMKVNAKTSLDMLKAFSEIPGRRTISDLKHIMDTTELNEFLRLVYNNDHRTIDSKVGIRSADYMIKKGDSPKDNIIIASKKGLSFCSTLRKLIEVIGTKAKYSKNTKEIIHVYKVHEATSLPLGLAFNKDTPGHVSLIATHDMSWNDMINKLRRVSDMLELVTTIPLYL